MAAFLNRLVSWGQTAANRWHEVGSCAGWAMCASLRQQPRGGDGGMLAGPPAAAPARNGGAPGSIPSLNAASVAAAYVKDGYLSAAGQPPKQQQLLSAAGKVAAAPLPGTAAAALQRPKPPLPPKPSQQ